MTIKIHPTAEVLSHNIGEGTTIWQNVVVLPGACIGEGVNICAHCFIENQVHIGDRSTLKCGVYLWDGVTIGQDVFVGPNATFSNDKFPRSKMHDRELQTTMVEDGASIGAGAILLPGIKVGRGAMVGAGAVVTGSVPPYAIVMGNPARITGYVERFSSCPPLEKPIELSWHTPSTNATLPLGIGATTLHRLQQVSDLRGDLCVGEFGSDIPFEPKRYFMVHHVPSQKTRGEHAHKLCQQFLVCISGSCAVVVDDGTQRREVLLDSPEKGIYVPPMIWSIQYKYSPDAVLLVFASHAYDPKDYIRDYDDYCKACGKIAE